jgi:SAM-dependent methyltransferase
MEPLPRAGTMWKSKEEVDALEKFWAEDKRGAEIEAIAAEMIKKVPYMKVLDLGCGSARYSQVVPYWEAYTGVDASEHMLALAKTRTRRWPKRQVELVHSSVLEYETKKTFDIALCICVNHHQPDPLGFASQVLARYTAKSFLMTFVVYEGEAGTFRDFKIGWDGDEDGSNIASRSIARVDFEMFLKDKDVIDQVEAPVFWHTDAKYIFVMFRGAK